MVGQVDPGKEFNNIWQLWVALDKTDLIWIIQYDKIGNPDYVSIIYFLDTSWLIVFNCLPALGFTYIHTNLQIWLTAKHMSQQRWQQNDYKWVYPCWVFVSKLVDVLCCVFLSCQGLFLMSGFGTFSDQCKAQSMDYGSCYALAVVSWLQAWTITAIYCYRKYFMKTGSEEERQSLLQEQLSGYDRPRSSPGP